MKTKKIKIFEAARGYYGRRKNTWTVAIRAVHNAWQRAYIDRRRRVRDYRTNWIQQINIGARQFGISYSQVIRQLPAAGVDLNRKMLSDLAVTEPYSFRAVIEVAKQQLLKDRGSQQQSKKPQYKEKEMR